MWVMDLARFMYDKSLSDPLYVAPNTCWSPMFAIKMAEKHEANINFVSYT